jgi:hypothetical protein
VTFNKDVLPVLQKNCQSCHRPGQMAPMSLLTFRDARPWARAMKSKVESRQMPPWFADPSHGEFANDPSLPARDIETIAKWADAGALEGDAKDAPPPVQWPADGWQIKPDIVVRGPEFRVPARTPNDVVEWVTFLIPSIHQGHVDHVARDQAERAGRDASHLLHVRAASAQREVLRRELVGVAA